MYEIQVPGPGELEFVRQKIKPLREKRMRMRAIFLKLRKGRDYELWSDLVLFNSIHYALDDLALSYSKREVYSTFKLINKDDYPRELKSALLRHAIKNAKSKSVFTTNNEE